MPSASTSPAAAWSASPPTTAPSHPASAPASTARELSVPYYAFLDAGMDGRGGQPRRRPDPDRPAVAQAGPALRRRRPAARRPGPAGPPGQLAVDRVARPRPAYDAVYLAGGWGAAFDFATSDDLAAALTEAAALGLVIGGVCHGPLGLVNATTPDGAPLVEGRRVSAVTDKQVRELKIESTPFHPETELRRARRPLRVRHPLPRPVRQPLGGRRQPGHRPEPERRPHGRPRDDAPPRRGTREGLSGSSFSCSLRPAAGVACRVPDPEGVDAEVGLVPSPGGTPVSVECPNHLVSRTTSAPTFWCTAMPTALSATGASERGEHLGTVAMARSVADCSSAGDGAAGRSPAPPRRLRSASSALRRAFVACFDGFLRLRLGLGLPSWPSWSPWRRCRRDRCRRVGGDGTGSTSVWARRADQFGLADGPVGHGAVGGGDRSRSSGSSSGGRWPAA